jgi:hypothetical protein
MQLRENKSTPNQVEAQADFYEATISGTCNFFFQILSWMLP